MQKCTNTRWITSWSQCDQLPKIDLTKLKSMTEEDWKEIVQHIPFYPDFMGARRDYRDRSNLGCGNFIFKPKVFKTAKESGMTMLKTLNFMNYD